MQTSQILIDALSGICEENMPFTMRMSNALYTVYVCYITAGYAQQRDEGTLNMKLLDVRVCPKFNGAPHIRLRPDIHDGQRHVYINTTPTKDCTSDEKMLQKTERYAVYSAYDIMRIVNTYFPGAFPKHVLEGVYQYGSHIS